MPNHVSALRHMSHLRFYATGYDGYERERSGGYGRVTSEAASATAVRYDSTPFDEIEERGKRRRGFSIGIFFVN